MTSRIWYVIAGGLVATAVAIGLLGFSQAASTVEGMQRAAMPGKVEIVLPAGPTTLYAEARSMIDGKVFQVDGELQFRCGVADPQQRALTLTAARASVEYAMSGYAGRSAFDVEVPTAGTYVLECAAEQPFVMAIGRGVGTWIVIALVALVPAGIGLVMALVVFVKRRRQQRAAAP